jgi:hypothetical protein
MGKYSCDEHSLAQVRGEGGNPSQHAFGAGILQEPELRAVFCGGVFSSSKRIEAERKRARP